MTDVAASAIIEKVIELLVTEASFFIGVDVDVESLKKDLKFLKCYLRDAESRLEQRDTSESIQTWLKQVKEEADSIEDVIDKYVLQLALCHHHYTFPGFLHHILFIIKSLKPRHKMGSKIKNIRASLQQIEVRAIAFGLMPLESVGTSYNRLMSNVQRHDPRLGSLFIEESELVGIESQKNEVIKSLVAGQPRHMVISLAGTGGIGKTTLAKIVYEDDVVIQYFDCFAWINVSQSYDINNLLKDLVRRVCSKEGIVKENDTIEDIIRFLRDFLKTKRYLVVFDDVWNTDLWEVMKLALPSISNNGSRIIITTRIDSTVEPWKSISDIKNVKLQLLSDKDSFDLLLKKICLQVPSEEDYQMKELFLEIVRKCNGLPLAIVSISGLLLNKEKTVFELRKLLNNISLEFRSNPHLTNVYKILNFSYEDLPHHLKRCMLYFGVFPEDHFIDVTTLCRLWIAEDFIKSVSTKKTLEEVAEEYLIELVKRNLVILFEHMGEHTGKWCKIHDITREVILSKFDESHFCQILDKNGVNFKGKAKRLSIHHSANEVFNEIEYDGVRSVFLFNSKDTIISNKFLLTLFQKFQLLTLLDLRDAPFDTLPKEVGKLFHLQYLDMRNTKIKILPRSIGKLKNLEALIIYNTLVYELPIEINRLKMLRHLIVYSINEIWERTSDQLKTGTDAVFCRGMRLVKGIGNLEQLQTLDAIEAHPHGLVIAKELEKLKELRKLCISKVTSNIEPILCASIEKLINLIELDIRSISKAETLDLQLISSPPPLLKWLLLDTPLTKMPNWIGKLEHLSKLYLISTRLRDNLLKRIHGLPNLKVLSLSRAYDGEILHFEEGGFLKLNKLRLLDLCNLKDVKIDNGVMPLLEKLEIGNNPLLEQVPHDIHKLRNLKLLEIYDMSWEFVKRMQRDGGQDHYTVNHIPTIRILYKEGENKQGFTAYDVYKLGDVALQYRLHQAGLFSSSVENDDSTADLL